jgi:hypothetical protein
MSTLAGWLVVADGEQGGNDPTPAYETVVIVLLIAAMTVACVLIVKYLRSRDRRPKPVSDQWQALAVMGELCAHGWQAQITLYGWGAPLPADAPPSPVPLVELEWKQFDEEYGRVAVARRVWARTIGDALQKMVEDRQTDISLEMIEQAVADADAEDEDEWSEE